MRSKNSTIRQRASLSSDAVSFTFMAVHYLHLEPRQTHLDEYAE